MSEGIFKTPKNVWRKQQRTVLKITGAMYGPWSLGRLMFPSGLNVSGCIMVRVHTVGFANAFSLEVLNPLGWFFEGFVVLGILSTFWFRFCFWELR